VTALVARFAMALVGATSAVLVVAWVMACQSPLPTPAQQIDEGLWTAGDAKCLAENGTRAAVDACQDALRVAACGPGGSFADAGVACQDVRLSDGGKP
jgi:hypothetical protein